MKGKSRVFLMSLTALITVAAMLLSGAAAIPGSKAVVETVVVSEGNSAPIAENIELKTFRGIAVSGTLKALDPEEERVTFEIVDQPKRGTLSVGENGTFVYDPGSTKRSSDSFTYTATDASGNKSEPATVSIQILRQKEAVVYEDMRGSIAHYAALALNEADVMTGECIAGRYFFRPEEAVTAGEFLAMCLKAADKNVLDGVVRTGLDNDSEIPMWAKQYVSTAVFTGCYTGGSTFNYSGTISCEDAAVMLNAVFDLTDVVSVSSISPYLRERSYQAVMNLYACDIADESIISNYDIPLTRENAAVLLCRAMEVMENRNG